MATRIAFFSSNEELYNEASFNFNWHPGFSRSQKLKSIDSLHNEILLNFNDAKILEISTKSPNDLGVKLSAYNLKRNINGKMVSVENIFQTSKVFFEGGGFSEGLNMESWECKKYIKEKTSGWKLKNFTFGDVEWPLDPKTLFYDWLYMTSLLFNRELSEEIQNYNFFTDIELGKDSINCQARAAAIFISLTKRKEIDILSMPLLEYIKKMAPLYTVGVTTSQSSPSTECHTCLASNHEQNPAGIPPSPSDPSSRDPQKP